MEIDIPRDRNSKFEPQLVKKLQTDVSSTEDRVIFLYSQGASTRDIQKTMQEMYGIDVDDNRVSKITDKLLPLIREWQEQPLQSVYGIASGSTTGVQFIHNDPQKRWMGTLPPKDGGWRFGILPDFEKNYRVSEM